MHPTGRPSMRSTMELICEKKQQEVLKKKIPQITVIKNLLCMYTNAKTLNK